MTLAQRERKRANDRRSQRASRARTRQHIQHLERELEGLRDIDPEDGGDENSAIQELIRRNQELEIELVRLRSASASPLSANSNFGGISGPARVRGHTPRDQTNINAPTAYLHDSILPVDNIRPMGSLMAPLESPVPDNFADDTGMRQSIVNYSLPNQYARVDIPRSTPNPSRLVPHYGEYQEGSAVGSGQELQYPPQADLGPFGATTPTPTKVAQAGARNVVGESGGSYDTDEYGSEAQGPGESLGWDRWQIDETGGETE